MASITENVLSKGSVGKSWTVRWTDSAGKQREKTCKTEKTAQALARRVEAEKEVGILPPPQRSLTLEKWTTRWLQEVPVRESTRTNYRNRMAGLLPILGSTPVNRLTPGVIQQALADLTAAPGTVRLTASVLSTCMAYAVREGLRQDNPMLSVRRPGKTRRVVGEPSVDDLHQLVAVTTLRLRALMSVLCWTGLRIGEALGLTEDEIDLKAGVLHLQHQLDNRKGVLGPLKTESSYRDVPLPEWTRTELRRHLKAQPRGPHGLLFTNTLGRPLKRSTFCSHAWAQALAKAGLTGLQPHGLRHAYASRLLANGADLADIQAVLGHADLSTLGIYIHATKGHRDRVLAALGG